MMVILSVSDSDSNFDVIVVVMFGDIVNCIRFWCYCCCCLWCCSSPNMVLCWCCLSSILILLCCLLVGFLCCCCCCLGHYVVLAVDLNFRFRWCCCCCYWSWHNRYNRTIPNIKHRIFLPCYHHDHHPENNFECTFFPCRQTPLDPLLLILLLIANAVTGTTILRYRWIPMNSPQQFFLRNKSCYYCCCCCCCYCVLCRRFRW